MLSYLPNNDAKIKAALTKLLEQKYEDDKLWFIITKNSNVLDNVQVNYHVQNLLLESLNKKSVDVPASTLIKFRNYFL